MALILRLAEAVAGALAGLLAQGFGLLPQACAVCGASARDSKFAYLATTLLLLAIPAGLLASLVVWLIRRAR